MNYEFLKQLKADLICWYTDSVGRTLPFLLVVVFPFRSELAPLIALILTVPGIPAGITRAVHGITLPCSCRNSHSIV